MEQEEKKRRENELALERKKREEEAHLEFLRAEREAVVAAARAKAIDEELGFEQEEHLSHLPIEQSSNRVREFINSQLRDVKPRDVKLEEPSKLTARDSPEETVKRETPTPQKPLNPGAMPFSQGQTTQNLRIN